MRIVLAPDSFKESMTAREAARAMAEGVKDADPRARTVLAPMSDGGEGFVDAVAAAWGADLVDADTVDALGRPIRAVYGLSGGRAVMDVAGCAGLELIAPADRDVLRSTTAGLGLLMRDALRRGARTILLGIGGSATNDAGVGMLHALGAGLLDADGRPLAPRPDQLDRLATIDASALAPLLDAVTIRVACDVTNPLTGPRQTFVSLRILVAKGLRLFRRPCLADDILLRLNIREPLEEIGLLQTYFSRLHLGDHAIKSLLIVEMEIQREATVSRFVDRFNRSHYFVFRLLLLNTILLSPCKYMVAPLNLWLLP